MLIKFPQGRRTAKATHIVCPFHKKFPKLKAYAGCTCSASFSMSIDRSTKNRDLKIKYLSKRTPLRLHDDTE
jgi:hypothetical protein